MHYYKRNIGDYSKKAGRLSILQHGVYTLLIDACYDRERFPTRDEALDWVWAGSPDEIAAVDFVLGKFFTLKDGRYVQKRIAEEVAEYHVFCEQQAAKGKAGGRPKKPDGNQAGSEENPVESQALTVESLTTNQEPLTTNQEKENEPSAPGLPDGLNIEAWGRYFAYRQKLPKKNRLTEEACRLAFELLVQYPLETQKQMINDSIMNGWTGLFPPKGATNGQTNHAPKPNAFDRSKQKLADWERQHAGGSIIDGEGVGEDERNVRA